MGYYEDYEKASTESHMRTCPICNKRFYPAPEHAYKIGYESSEEREGRLVCSYHCMREWEKNKAIAKSGKETRDAKKKQATLKLTGFEAKMFMKLLENETEVIKSVAELSFIQGLTTKQIANKINYTATRVHQLRDQILETVVKKLLENIDI